jgi:hypothetical protein
VTSQPQGWAIAFVGTPLETGPVTYREIAAGYQTPSWSPSGAKLAVSGISTINPDGTGAAFVTSGSEPRWAPDGARIVFSGPDPACTATCPPEIWLVDPDGTDRTRLTTTSASERTPDWQPAIGTPAPGYPRPKGASPLYVPLVPAYRPCPSGNLQHGPPLAYTSCGPPAQTSQYLTTGTPDANGAPAGMVGSLRLGVLAGNVATLADEADVAISFHVTDVRCTAAVVDDVCSEPNQSGPEDYAGSVRVRMSLRLTDLHNLPAPAGRSAATSTNLLFQFDAGCTVIDDFDSGSTCDTETSTDAILPVSTEGKRASLALGQVEVVDGGQDGTTETGPNQVFLRQGLFVP